MADADLDTEPPQEQLRLGDQQLVTVADLAAEVVGQSAVGEGHIRVTLEDDDASVLVHAPGARGGGCAAGDSTDDEDGGGGFGHGIEVSWQQGVARSSQRY